VLRPFFRALWNYDTTEYKDLQLIMALSEHFSKTTCTFHFPGFVITGLRLGGRRIEGHDTISPTDVKDYLGVNPSRVSGNNVSLMWLYSNIER
ncbi:hypothetical protein SO802_005996, partial [Lithocarpus litseifolius]